jgi:hypothetical protein
VRKRFTTIFPISLDPIPWAGNLLSFLQPAKTADMSFEKGIGSRHREGVFYAEVKPSPHLGSGFSLTKSLK